MTAMLVTWKWFSVLFAVNADECLMTRMQEMSLDYHFTVEQEVGSSTYAFFGFNGKSYVTAVALQINVTKSFIELKLSCI
jgi:hypothetical protein